VTPTPSVRLAGRELDRASSSMAGLARGFGIPAQQVVDEVVRARDLPDRRR